MNMVIGLGGRKPTKRNWKYRKLVKKKKSIKIQSGRNLLKFEDDIYREELSEYKLHEYIYGDDLDIGAYMDA